MDINNDDKLKILLEVAKQRFTEVEQMRNRAYQIITWVIGSFVIFVGWIIQSTATITITQKIFASIAICFASGSVTWFVRNLETSFKRQFTILTKIETLLGLYKPGFFDTSSQDSLFPQTWAEKPGSGKFFPYIQLLLLICTIFLVIIIIAA